MAAGGGKALALETKVLTPTGWSTVGELTVGDLVLDEKGRKQKILAEYFQPKQELLEVEFNDGAIITCCPNHLWEVSFSGDISTKSTKEIKEWMEKTGRHPTIPLYSPDENEELFEGDNTLPIDPYLLGFLLGDGHFGDRATLVSTGDPEIISYINNLGYETTKYTSNDFDYRIRGLDINKKIKALNLTGKKSHTKFIPRAYLNSSFRNRKKLLSGLLDSDGYRKSGSNAAEFCVTSPLLAEGVQYLVRSLGGTAKLSLKETTFTYKGRKKSGSLAYRLYIRLQNLDEFFMLQRKKSIPPKNPRKRNAIISIHKGKEDFSKCFMVSGERSLFVIENFIVTHNSYALLMDSLKYIDCPYFYAVYFRKTVKQLERTLWPEAKDLFYPFLIEYSGPRKGKYKGKAQIREKDKIIIFPSGAKIEFSYLDRDDDAKENWQGAQLTAAYMDEFSHFSRYVFNYIRTRMRSKSKYKSFIRASLNPDPNHFVLEYLERFIGDDGLAIPEYSGRIAYYISDRGQIVTAWTEEELLEKYPKKKPRKYTFIPSYLSDNPKMLETNEDYADDLASNDPANAALLLDGNWKYSPAANGAFERSTVQIADKVPLGAKNFRCWDKASSKPSKEGGDSKQRDPDYTASLLFSKDKEGNIYISGNYRRANDGEQYARFREKPGVRDDMILAQARKDGIDTVIYLPQDPAAAGAAEYKESAKKLQAEGFVVKKDPSVVNKSKRLRFEPFAAACHNGIVYWVRNTFDAAVWDYIIRELENFDGDKNNGYHDDMVDVCSTGYAACQKEKVYTAVQTPKIDAPTLYNSYGLTAGISPSRQRFPNIKL